MKGINLAVLLLCLTTLVSCDGIIEAGPRVEILKALTITNKCTDTEYQDYASTFSKCYNLASQPYFTDEQLLACQDALELFTETHGEKNCNVLNDQGNGIIEVGHTYLSQWRDSAVSMNENYHQDASGEECSDDLETTINFIIENDYEAYSFQKENLINRAIVVNCYIDNEYNDASTIKEIVDKIEAKAL